MYKDLELKVFYLFSGLKHAWKSMLELVPKEEQKLINVCLKNYFFPVYRELGLDIAECLSFIEVCLFINGGVLYVQWSNSWMQL